MLATARSSSWPGATAGRASSAASKARRRARKRRTSARALPAAGSAGAPRLRATTRSPNAASSSPKDCSTAAMSMRCGGYAPVRGGCHHAWMQIQFLGGATTVTGSQFLLTTDRAKVLIDCGMFQGSPNESIRNRLPFAFDPHELDAVLLTHAHLDHCGLLPLLVKAGYRGRIHATAGTVELADARPAGLGQAPRGVRQARGTLGEASPGRGRRRRPARGRRVPGRASTSRRPARSPSRKTERRPAASTSRRPSNPSRPPGPPTRRPSFAPSRRTSRSISTSRCTPPRTPNGRSLSSRPSTTGPRSRSRPGSTPRSRTPATSSARRSSGCGSRTRRAARSGSSSAPATSDVRTRRSCAIRRR